MMRMKIGAKTIRSDLLIFKSVTDIKVDVLGAVVSFAWKLISTLCMYVFMCMFMPPTLK
jgi:hypothetical protein